MVCDGRQCHKMESEERKDGKLNCLRGVNQLPSTRHPKKYREKKKIKI